MNKLVSIIIPTYQRAHLLQETLDSILGQNYSNWECIIVDDLSSDGTEQIVKGYIDRDDRFRYFTRPVTRLQGGNAARNFGFEQSKGIYIIWFDSDDLMTPDHIHEKVKEIETTGADFIVAKTANFQDGKLFPPYFYEKKAYGIKSSDFILMKIHWYTYDVLMKRSIAENIRWNESMLSWQDYNYFCKMLIETENGIYLNKVLTYRRLHSNSIQKKLTVSKAHFLEKMLYNRLLTFEDLKKHIDGYTKRELIYDMMNISFNLSNLKHLHFKNFQRVVTIVIRYRGVMSFFLFLSSLITVFVYKKGEYLLEKSKNRKHLLQ